MNIALILIILRICHLFSSINAAKEGDIRLMGDSSHAGRLEYYYDSAWGTVCHSGSDMGLIYKIVCLQLGFSEGASLKDIKPGTGKIWLEHVQCEVNVTKLSNCKLRYHDEKSSWKCDHSDDVGVICNNSAPSTVKSSTVQTTKTKFTFFPPTSTKVPEASSFSPIILSLIVVLSIFICAFGMGISFFFWNYRKEQRIRQRQEERRQRRIEVLPSSQQIAQLPNGSPPMFVMQPNYTINQPIRLNSLNQPPPYDNESVKPPDYNQVTESKSPPPYTPTVTDQMPNVYN
ncbi:DgyrCDS12364 [Dimorphilus gyrociliatus]|uniref:DgyrCDS12364 n=1 Tax=Dimorphilus gyrociliatus TaxID=2664684 RepID=A0A7I8W842_9ANNE|nr:DgyrCDS12364 [Dimorphilus gyrociliatus]